MSARDDPSAWLKWMIDRIPGGCIIQTDAHGIVTHFGPGAEVFFACLAKKVLGKLSEPGVDRPGDRPLPPVPPHAAQPAISIELISYSAPGRSTGAN